jgi:hypothetical protein
MSPARAEALASSLETKVFRPGEKLSTSQVFGSLTIVTEPSTLRISLEGERTIRLVLGTGETANETTMLERQRHTFDY